MPIHKSPIKLIPQDYFQPGSDRTFIIPEGLDKGKSIFFQDFVIGKKNQRKTVVFVHGNPECSYTYRHVIKEILDFQEDSLRILAMDHIGFGLSDQASHEMNWSDHANNLYSLITHFDLKNVILVIHDWGGPIGIGAFLREPERVEGMVILNSTVFPIPEKELSYTNYPISWLGWSKTPLIIPDKFWGAFAAVALEQQPESPVTILTKLIPRIKAAEKMAKRRTPSASKVFHDQFLSASNVKSSKRMVKESAVWGMGYRYADPNVGLKDNSKDYTFIQESIAKSWGNLRIGVKAVVGGWDPLGQTCVLEQWVDQLPQLSGHIEIFENCGHFIEEEQPKAIAHAILELVKK